MINSKYPISISRQCQLLHVGRSSYYYPPQGETDFNQQLMNEIDQQFLKTPYYGVQQMVMCAQSTGDS
jgi:putative transposase